MASANSSASPNWGARSEAERWLEIAGRLLHARDLVGSKRFAERAMEVDPLISGVDEVLAITDVLLASQRPPLPGGQPDYYALLLLPPSSDSQAVKLSFRRLSLVLSPSGNPHPGADLALRHVSDAFNFLSDPSRKRLYDQSLHPPTTTNTAASATSQPPPPSPPSPTPPSSPPASSTFWTICTSCFRAHEYDRVHLGRTLRCLACSSPFLASELPSPPPIVPDTDMYYCNWGLFPIGFPGCPAFAGVRLPDSVARSPLFLQPRPSADNDHEGDRRQNGDNGNWSSKEKRTNATTSVLPTNPVNQKPSADQKAKNSSSSGRQRGRPRKNQPAAVTLGQADPQLPRDAAAEDEGENIGDIPPGFDMNSFSIDLDATADALGTFAHLPFVRDDEVVMMR